MTHLDNEQRAQYVQRMFARIAHRYDLMNRLMTAGQDARWRREVIRRADLQSGDMLLDLGAGTGDLAREALKQCERSRVIAGDFTLEMMRVGQARFAALPIAWSASDALRLPFADQTFDAIVSGFLLRNVIDLRRALREQYRVLKPGGHIVALDTTQPTRSILAPFIRFHMHTIIPMLGRLIAGASDAYTYLPDSTESFLQAEVLADRLREAGFEQVGFKKRMFGTVAIHWGQRSMEV